MNMVLLTFGLVALMLSKIVLLMLSLVFNLEMLIINIKYIAANELNSLISLINHELAASSDKSYPNIKHYESTSYYSNISASDVTNWNIVSLWQTEHIVLNCISQSLGMVRAEALLPTVKDCAYLMLP